MKSFASATLMAVFASAQEGTDYWGTGATRFNALVTNLFESDDDSTKLDLHTYYVDDNDAGDEFHLDLVLYFPDADFEPNIEYGFCFAVSTDDSQWDCMRARTTIDVDALATEVDDDTYDTIDDFDLNDMVENSGTAGIQTFDAVALQSDDLITTDSAQDWAIASAKSFKSGCVTGSVADTVRCDWINVHMDRLFATGDDDDIDLSALDAATDFVVYGWIATSSSELTGDYVAANLQYSTAAPGATATLLSGKSAYEALTEEDKITINDWQATLDPRNPTPTVLEESDDDDDAEDSDDDDAEDSDDDADDSDEEVPDAASYMTVAAATITAVGAILI